jgi:hypothetical protein
MERINYCSEGSLIDVTENQEFVRLPCEHSDRYLSVIEKAKVIAKQSISQFYIELFNINLYEYLHNVYANRDGTMHVPVH